MKNKQKNIVITPELVSKFVTGQTSIEEWLTVLAAMRENPEIREIVTTSLRVNGIMNETEQPSYQPSEATNRTIRKKIAELSNDKIDKNHSLS